MKFKSHLVAKALYAIWESSIGDRAIGSIIDKAQKSLGEARRKAQKWLLDTAERIDEMRPCPHCKRPTMLSELEQLKTYCYACSHWGQEPIDESGATSAAPRIRPPLP